MSRSAFKLSNVGALHLPMALLFSTIALAGFYLLTVMHLFRIHAQEQLDMDECVKQATEELRSTQNLLIKDNQLIEAGRLSLQAGAANYPPAAAAISATLTGLVIHQEIWLAKWKVRQLDWLLQPCGTTQDQPQPLPDLNWSRKPPDNYGPFPLEWSPKNQKKLRIMRRLKNRYSSTLTEENEDGQSWQSRWSGLY